MVWIGFRLAKDLERAWLKGLAYVGIGIGAFGLANLLGLTASPV